MTLKNRLAKAEKVTRAATPETTEIYIIYDAEGYVTHNGERLTLAEFDARPKGANDTVIAVKYADGEKVTDFGQKRYIGVSPLDWDLPQSPA